MRFLRSRAPGSIARPADPPQRQVARSMSDTVSATISSRRNPRVVEARKLAQRKHRARQGRFLVEGLQLLGMGLEAGARPREAFYCPELASSDAASRLVDRMAEAGAEVLVVTPPVMSALAERDAPQGLIASFDMFGSDVSDVSAVDVPSDGLVVVLDRLQDPGNLGTLIRTADAVGASAVVLVQPSVDPFELKAVRGSMGSVFNVPLVFVRDADALFSWLGAIGLRIVVADAHAGEPWGDSALAAWSRPLARQRGARIVGRSGGRSVYESALADDRWSGIAQRGGRWWGADVRLASPPSGAPS